MLCQFLALAYLPSFISAVFCSENSDCTSLCCLKKIYHPFASGQCEKKLMLGDYCLPNQKPVKIVRQKVYMKSCPCKSGLQCIPEYVRNKDQTILIVNPRCDFAPPETTVSPEVNITTEIFPTTPCVSKGPLIVNLSISIPLP